MVYEFVLAFVTFPSEPLREVAYSVEVPLDAPVLRFEDRRVPSEAPDSREPLRVPDKFLYAKLFPVMLLADWVADDDLLKPPRTVPCERPLCIPE